MDKEEVKILAFEYVLNQLVAWYKDVHERTDDENDISILKALKLLFFISAVSAQENNEESLLDGIFDNFVAMPYGHVESDVYYAIKAKSHANISINNKQTFITTSSDLISNSELHSDYKIKIDSSISKLKEINKNLIKMSPFDLVELSHCWYSWKYYFAKARRNNTFSESIPNEIIKLEQKIFFLS